MFDYVLNTTLLLRYCNVAWKQSNKKHLNLSLQNFTREIGHELRKTVSREITEIRDSCKFIIYIKIDTEILEHLGIKN